MSDQLTTILFVDDEADVRSALRRVFCETPHRLLFADSAETALRLVGEHQVAVVVSDNNMPGMKGIELLSRLKRVSPDTVRIMMTAYADLPTAIAAINQSEAFRFITKPWDNEQLQEVVAEGVQRFELLQGMRSGDEARYLALAQTVELKDPYTRGHCERVAAYACRIGQAAGMNECDLIHLRHGAILHDCGKIGVPEGVLNFPGRLSEQDFELVKKHPVWGCEVARQAQLPEMVQQVILRHHERFDGRGYPDGLAGSAIPLAARIATIADVYDALTTDRPYRKGHQAPEAARYMTVEMGGYFDPELLRLFWQELEWLDGCK